MVQVEGERSTQPSVSSLGPRSHGPGGMLGSDSTTPAATSQQDPPVPFETAYKTDQDFYLLLRQRLDQLDYHQPLSLDSASLVQQLLVDLIQTTETVRTFKSQLDIVTAERDEARERLKPLIHDLSKSTVECNHLHLDLIRMADERDVKDNRARQTARHLEAQIADLHFISRQHQLQIESEQAQAEDARKRAEEAFAKVGQLSKTPKAQLKQVTLQASQRIDLEGCLEPLEIPSYLIPTFPPPDPVAVDMLKISEARIDMLNRSQTDLTHKNADLEQQILVTREQLSKREREITRLASELEVAKAENNPLNFTTLSCSQPSLIGPDGATEESVRLGVHSVATALERIKQLEGQVVYLNEHIDHLEAELDKSKRQRQEATSEEDDRKIDILSQELAREKDKNVQLFQKLTALEKSLAELAVLKTKSTAATRLQTPTKHQSTRRKSVQEQSLPKSSTPKAVISTSATDPQHSVENLNQVLHESSEKVAKLERKLAEANYKLDREMQEHETAVQAKANALQSLERCEQEKDHLFQALKAFEGQLLCVQEHAEALRREKDAISSLYEQLSARRRESLSNSSPKRETTEISTSPSASRKAPAVFMTSAAQTLDEAGATARKVDLLQRSVEEREQAMQALTKERDSLMNALQNFEKQLQKLQVQVEQATSEKETLLKQLAEKKRDLDQNKERQAYIIEIDKERDRFQQELDVKAERIAHLEQMISKHESQLRSNNEVLTKHQEKIALLNSQLSSHDIDSSSLQKHLDKLTEENETLSAQFAKESSENTNLIADLSALTRENQSLHAELANITQDRDFIQGEMQATDRQLQWLESNIKDKEGERESLLSAYRKLIAEHERLDSSFKGAAEDINHLRMDLIMKEKLNQNLKAQLEKAAEATSSMSLDLDAFEKQVQHLSRALASTERSLAHATSDKTRMARELEAAKHLGLSIDKHRDGIHRKMTALSLENQTLEKTLATLEKDREEALDRLQSERMKVDRLEQLLASERDRQIQSGIPSVVREKRADEKEKYLLSENGKLKSQLNSIQNEMKSLDGRYQDLKREFSQLLESGSFSMEGVMAPASPSIVSSSQSQSMTTPTRSEQLLRDQLSSTKKERHKYDHLIKRRQKSQSGSPSTTRTDSGPSTSSSESDLLAGDDAPLKIPSQLSHNQQQPKNDLPVASSSTLPIPSAIEEEGSSPTRRRQPYPKSPSQIARDREVLDAIANSLGANK